MWKDRLIRKAKQAWQRLAREELNKHLKGIEIEYVVSEYVNDKPKRIPQFIRNKLLRIVLNPRKFI